VQAVLLRSFERACQEPNKSTAVYGVEDADLVDGDCEDADQEDDRHRRAALLAKKRREAWPTPMALLHRQMVHGRMERRHAKRVANGAPEDGMKTGHNIDVGPSDASNDDNDNGEVAA
jgi:hypothetical protein